MGEGGLAVPSRRAPKVREDDVDVRRLMTEAIVAAADAMPHPNPRVGAIVVDPTGSVVGRGSHRGGPGHPHAEVIALLEAGERARNGTVVVTLEPCAHEGRTPPCTDLILRSGVARVVVGAVDPDPRVAGRGIKVLRRAGVTVDEGIEAEAVEGMDPGYFHHRRTGRPRVTLKAAITLDGEVAARDGSSQWITSPEARADAHLLRSRADAVLVGSGTVVVDDPRLTVRVGEPDRQPHPVVIAGNRPLPADASILARKPTVFAPAPVDLPTEVVVLPGSDGVDLFGALEHLGSAGIVDVLVEGGPRIASAFWRAGLVSHGVFYLGARIAGGAGSGPLAGTFATLADASPIVIESAVPIGPDLRVDFTPRGP
jgi:diaminohydroxyphosphoribosylaminopyrimidine deaminase/5-amino-6-(5-phosphoribosylamino)uracil reductase